ncbi:snRNA-activating protein complex subunit 1 [Entomortierella parvispora]|uniref:snRNA-activating protein complex subunit 1 n=1 Tax=Entomortierella parvispora TaxID=205924 RepID=A0A9P3H615_9FUNG|nr:snRNA-activating protein complex subunit 1 [Entomortierella parvispora]
MSCLSCGKSALIKNALLEDISQLLGTFEASPVSSYASFVASWRKHRMALVHFAAPQGQARSSFTQAIYDSLLARLASRSLKSKAGAVFGLFMFYFSQPSRFKKAGIRMTTTQWQDIQDLYIQAFRMDALDLISVIHQLRQRNAFIFVANSKLSATHVADESANLAALAEDTLLRLEKDTLDDNGLVPIAPLMTDLYDMSSKYYYAKRDLVTLSLTRNASGAVLTHLAKQHPSEINLRHAEPVPSFVIKEHLSEGKAKSISTTSNLATNMSRDQDVEMTNIVEMSSEQNQETQPALVDLLVKAQEKHQLNPTGDTEKLRNELPALPDIFPISILQASRSDYIRDVEAVMTSYVQEQYSRYKFAATGALRRNDYEFLPPRRVEKRTPQEQYAFEQQQRMKRKKLKMKIREEKRQARERAGAEDKTTAALTKAAEGSRGGEEAEGDVEALQSLTAKSNIVQDIAEVSTSDDLRQGKGQDGNSDTSQTDDSFDPYAELLRSMTTPSK